MFSAKLSTELDSVNVVTKRQRIHESSDQASSAARVLREGDVELTHDKPLHLVHIAMASNATPAQDLPPKGRKRFMADLRIATDACKSGIEIQSLRVKGVYSSIHCPCDPVYLQGPFSQC